MTIFANILIYIMCWSVFFFMILPWRAHPVAEAEQLVGNCQSAPAQPFMGRKILLTTLLSTVVWGIIFYLVELDIINIRRWLGLNNI